MRFCNRDLFTFPFEHLSCLSHVFFFFLNSCKNNLRVMWKMASQALMWERKALPSPCPEWAPFTRPAMSTTFRKAGTLLESQTRRRWDGNAGNAGQLTQTDRDTSSPHSPGWFVVLAQEVKAIVGHWDPTLVGVNSAEGEVFCSSLTFGEHVEKRGFPVMV